MAQVSLRQIKKTYPNGFTAVHGVDLEIKDGEFMVFVGPSGCAKSTLLRMVAGLEKITAGEMWIGSKQVNDLAPKERGIAMVFQNYALYPHMKVYENLAFGLKLSGISKQEVDQRVRHAAELLEMTHLLDRFPKQLSGGQAQRVAVGRAIVKKPEVFLFDEPLSNLDAKLRASMRVRLTDLHRTLRDSGQAATSIYVTHDQVEAMTMADKIVVLRAGRVEQVGSPEALYQRPCNTFVAGFIGSPRMNFLPFAALNGASSLTRGLPSHTDQVGIRPEHWQLCEAGQGLSIEVISSEYMGSQRLLQARFGETHRLEILVTGEQAIHSGQTLHVQVSPEHLHAFDAQGQRIKSSAA